jgi:hypothetical protein
MVCPDIVKVSTPADYTVCLQTMTMHFHPGRRVHADCRHAQPSADHVDLPPDGHDFAQGARELVGQPTQKHPLLGLVQPPFPCPSRSGQRVCICLLSYIQFHAALWMVTSSLSKSMNLTVRGEHWILVRKQEFVPLS